MLRKLFIFIISLFISQMSTLAHGSWQQHAEDMYQVFGFERNEELTNWMKFVSSVLIDNNNADCAFSGDGKPFNFYSYLQEKYPNFQCKHRLLFHWGYNSRPWTPYLEEKVLYYGWSEKMIQDFQTDLMMEQKRRNGYANEYTENVFGFAHGGKEARIARVLVSIAYDVHLLGDYEPDNSDLDGLQNIESVIGDIINNLNAIDKKQSAMLCKQLKATSQDQTVDVQEKARLLMNILKDNFSSLLKIADDGKIVDHLLANGMQFENLDYAPSINEEDTSIKKKSNQKEKRKHSEKGDGVGVIIIISLIALGILCVLLFKKQK